MEGRLVGGKFRLGTLLGRGGKAEVWAATELASGRLYALKICGPDSSARTPQALERLRREAAVASRLRHPNVCEVLEVGQLEDGSPFLVMPLLRGRTLAEVLLESGALPLPRALALADQLLAGLGAAHADGVIHRDLKPSNVFLETEDGSGEKVRILDFGICRLEEPDDLRGELTGAGTVVGTPAYMAPEQARARPVDVRVDVWAAGVMLYEMLTGRKPFVAASPNALVAAILLDPVPPPAVLRPDLPRTVEAVVLRALERDRDARFADADAMRAALLAAVEDPHATAFGTTTERGP